MANPDTPPIKLPNHALEYRAIGLVKGRFVPDQEKGSRGILITSDEIQLKAFMGWLQPYAEKYLDLGQEHLWVVYPKRYPTKNTMSVQLKGFRQAKPDEPPPEGDGYFSIRGEVIQRQDESGFVVVKVRRNRVDSSKGKEVEIRLEGFVPPDTVGQFCEFECERDGQDLVIVDGKPIAPVQSPEVKEIPNQPKPVQGSPQPPKKLNKHPSLLQGAQSRQQYLEKEKF